MKIAKEQFELLPSVGGMAVGILNPDLSNFLLTVGIHNHNHNHFLRLNHLMLSSHCLGAVRTTVRMGDITTW